MNKQADWELMDDDSQPKRQFGQRDFLYALLGKYPRLKLAGLAAAGVLTIVLLALFSVVLIASASVAGIIVLFAAWCRAMLFKQKNKLPVHIVGK